MSKFAKVEDGVRLLNAGYSVMVVDEQKSPLVKWKELQTTPWKEEQLREYVAMPNVWRYGLITGFGNLFCIDIDLKVFPNVNDREPFFEELISFIKDNIDSFDEKVAIYKTANFGYHLVFRAKTDMGNTKLARREGHKEAVIETRGNGGYIVVYDNHTTPIDYTQVQLLDEEEFETIIGICRYFDQPPKEQRQEKLQKQQTVGFDPSGITPWDDFNRKNTVMDVIGGDFEIVRTISTRYIIRRHGAESAHSGYIYRDTGCLYLFSTATQYPNETLLSAFSCYVYKNHAGDFSAGAKAVYQMGYGDRIVRRIEIEQPPEIDKSKLQFPIEIFPDGIQHYIAECNRTLDSSIDYMGVSMMWMLSVIIGNSMRVKVKTGWTEGVVLWISVVGKAGLGKTPSIDNIVRPLLKMNSREIRDYEKKYAKFKQYESLDPKQKKTTEEVQEPVKKQFIVDDSTLEALVELHEQSPVAVGVFKDELAGWMKDMNKYRAGSDVETWLKSWSNKMISLNRKTVKNTHVETPCIPVLGGIQPGILNELFTAEQKENGFIDRMLLTYPDLLVDPYNENELDQELLEWYNDYIMRIHTDIRNTMVRFDDEMEIVPHIVEMTKEAKAEWIRIFNEITEMQNSDTENEYMKSMLPKQKSYVPRFALLLNALSNYHNGRPLLTDISGEAMRGAGKLSEYFIAMAKKLKVDTLKYKTMKGVIDQNSKLSKFEQFKIMLQVDPNLNKSLIAENMEVTRQTLIRWEKKIEDEKNKQNGDA